MTDQGERPGVRRRSINKTDFDMSSSVPLHTRKPSSVSSINTKNEPLPFVASSEEERLTPQTPAPFLTKQLTKTQKISNHFSKWSTPMVFILSIYSTLLSALWLAIAIAKPHWNNFVASYGGTMTQSTASTLVAAFAKTIELSFVTVVLACMGQFFTRKAMSTGSPGITLGDLQLKTLIVLPGTLITQFSSYRRVWRSFLGFVSLVACFAAIFYTTASDALVSPQPSIRPAAVQQLQGNVRTSIANAYYVPSSCPSPLNASIDEHAMNTCRGIDDAGLAYHNFIQFLTSWQQASVSQTQLVNEGARPLPVAMFNDNVTVTGSWVNDYLQNAVTSQNGRIINNVSMAMPHTGLAAASSLSQNGLIQVQNADRNAKVILDASAVTTVANVICASVTAEDLVPILYMNWTGAPYVDASEWPAYNKSTSWNNKTAFDSVFGFGSGSPPRLPPVFYGLPDTYNTMLSDVLSWPDHIYLLLASNFTASTSPLRFTTNYTLCSMRLSLQPGCSSTLTTTSSSSTLATNCSPGNPMAYRKDPLQDNVSNNWVQIAANWAQAISLAAGVDSADAAIAHQLSQLALSSPQFPSLTPSLAEALAVLSAGTLLSSTTDASFDGLWPPENTLSPTETQPNTYAPSNYIPANEPPFVQTFSANVRVSDFSSGGTATWQNVFFLALAPVFALNVLCLTYLALVACGFHWRAGSHRPRRGKATGLAHDCTEWRDLFGIALSSRVPGGLGLGTGMAGTGAGEGGWDEKKLLDTRWRVRRRVLGTWDVASEGNAGLDRSLGGLEVVVEDESEGMIVDLDAGSRGIRRRYKSGASASTSESDEALGMAEEGGAAARDFELVETIGGRRGLVGG